MALQAGVRLGPYEIVSSLGTGGMGEVYRALDTRLGRDVAIKILPANVATIPERLRRFQQEARAASALSHPNILTIYDVGQEGATFYIAAELVAGETLRQRLAKGPLSLDEVPDLATQIAAALAAAHHAGIVHRDIKPENVMIRPDGLVKVLDFGLAKLAEASTPLDAADQPTIAPAHTVPGFIVGTTSYMSPEQARGLAVDARTDVFSFGTLLYEMVAGRPPFEGPTPTDVLLAIVEHEPAPLSRHRPETSLDLQRIAARCLEKERERRYRSGQELLDDLKRLRASSSAVKALKPAPSIAVLPFANVSADPENEYFCDGLADEIINALTRLQGLRVIARTSSFAFRGREHAVREIGARLKVSTVLEGSVRKAGGRIRATVQLINVADESPLWSERFDRELTDIFAVQDEISQSVVDALKVKLGGEQRADLVKRYTENVEAYNLCLKGRFQFHKLTPEGFESGRRYFEEAIAADPNYAWPYVLLAHYHYGTSIQGHVPSHEAMPKARDQAMRALALDEALAEPHTFLGLARAYYEYQWSEGLAELQLATRLNPASGLAHMNLGLVLSTLGRLEEGAIALERAIENDPFSPLTQMAASLVASAAGRLEQAAEHARLALDVDPNFQMGFATLGIARAHQGRFDEAIPLLERSRALSAAPSWWAIAWLGIVYAEAGRHADAERLIADVSELAQARYVSPVTAAMTNDALGREREALEHLHKAVDLRDTALMEPGMLARVRRRPAYADLLRRMRLA